MGNFFKKKGEFFQNLGSFGEFFQTVSIFLGEEPFFFSRAKFLDSLRAFLIQKWDFPPHFGKKVGNFFKISLGIFFIPP